jgi:hypothetical protein
MMVWFGEEVVGDTPLWAPIYPKGLGADDKEETPVEPPSLPQLTWRRQFYKNLKSLDLDILSLGFDPSCEVYNLHALYLAQNRQAQRFWYFGRKFRRLFDNKRKPKVGFHVRDF